MCSGQNWVSLACRGKSESEFPAGLYCVLSAYSGNVNTSSPSSLFFNSEWENMVIKNNMHVLIY